MKSVLLLLRAVSMMQRRVNSISVVPLFFLNPNWLGLSWFSDQLMSRLLMTFSRMRKGISVRLMGL